jgi:hypothetical protein
MHFKCVDYLFYYNYLYENKHNIRHEEIYYK